MLLDLVCLGAGLLGWRCSLPGAVLLLVVQTRTHTCHATHSRILSPPPDHVVGGRTYVGQGQCAAMWWTLSPFPPLRSRMASIAPGGSPGALPYRLGLPVPVPSTPIVLEWPVRRTFDFGGTGSGEEDSAHVFRSRFRLILARIGLSAG